MRDLLADARTVLQKELHELVVTRARSPLSRAGIVAVVLMLGVILPLAAGPDWLDHGWLLSLWAWVPVFIVATVIADTVAGERERHTLETLLASPLPDRAILLGKIGAAVIFAWGLMLITIAISIVCINVVFAGDQLLLYRPVLLLGGGLLSLLTTILAASFGVLVSLRAVSVRRAQQIIVATLVSIFLVQFVGGSLLLRLLPGWQGAQAGLRGAFDSAALIAGVALLLVGCNALLLSLAGSRFQRERLHTQ